MKNTVFSVILLALMLCSLTACNNKSNVENIGELGKQSIGVAGAVKEKAYSKDMTNVSNGINSAASELTNFSDTTYTLGHAAQSVAENINIKNVKGLKLFTYYSTGAVI